MSEFVNPYNAHPVSYEQLAQVPTPPADGRWRPFPHVHMLDMVRNALSNSGINILEESHCLDKGGDRYFGTLWVDREQGRDVKIIGLRKSHDKSCAAALCGGVSVVVCSNMQFDGEIVVARKHTTNVLDGLPENILSVIGHIMQGWDDHDQRMGVYTSTPVRSQRDADTIIMEARRVGAIGNQQVMEVANLWDKPPHDEFRDRNVYNLLQAFTEAWKGPRFSRLSALPTRTRTLTRLLDRYVTDPSAFNAPLTMSFAGLGWEKEE